MSTVKASCDPDKLYRTACREFELFLLDNFNNNKFLFIQCSSVYLYRAKQQKPSQCILQGHIRSVGRAVVHEPRGQGLDSQFLLANKQMLEQIPQGDQ